MKTVFSIFIIFFLLFEINEAQSINISIDLGKNTFEFGEKIRSKVIIENNSNQEINLEKWCAVDGPYIDFVLKNEKNEIFSYYGKGIECFPADTKYIIQSNTKIIFPLNFYYSLDFVKKKYGRILPVGEYNLKGLLIIDEKKYYTNEIIFNVTAPLNANANHLLKEAINTAFIEKNEEKAIKLFNKIIEIAPTSIVSINAFEYIRYIIRNGEFYKNNYRTHLVQLQKEMTNHFINNFPNNRYVYNILLQIFTCYRDNDREIMENERISKYQNLFSLINNEEFRNELNYSINKFEGKNNYIPGMQIEKK